MGALVSDFSECIDAGGRVERENTTRYTKEYVCYVTDPEWTYEKGTVYVHSGGGEAGERSTVTTASATRSGGSLLSLTFACTGSMEPYITCLDTGTADSDFSPEDIQVGVVVGVDLSQDGCSVSGSRVIHRVSDVRGEGLSLELRTRGDANYGDDGCWLPYSRIRYVLVEVHKGTNSTPENVAARDSRTQAKAELDRAKAELDRVRAEVNSIGGQLDLANRAYDSYVSLNCTNRGGTWECSQLHIGEARRLHSVAESLHSRYSQAVANYNRLVARYNLLASAYASL